MGRIRTVKPELFRHAELFELEKTTGFPIRTAFAGLFTACDREGRFRWKPRELKLDVLPYDQLDFSDVLDAMNRAGFIVKYEQGNKVYGCIPTWNDHQVVNNKECASRFPGSGDEGCKILAPAKPGERRDTEESEGDASVTRESRDEHACPTRETAEQGEFELGPDGDSTSIPAVPEKPAGSAAKGKKSEMSEEDKNLYNDIKTTFEGVSGQFTDYKREGAAIKRIITFATKDAPESRTKYVRQMLIVFRRLTTSSDRYWASQPFIPSQMSSGGIWPRLKLELEKEAEKISDLDADIVGEAMAALGASKK